jgi:hypothetical protein
VILDALPTTIAPIRLDDPFDPVAAPDMVALVEQNEVAYLQLLLSEQNGMFQRFGLARLIGDQQVFEERHPRDLCVGDFNGDQIPDVFIANAGSGTLLGVHHLVLGQVRPAPPLASAAYRITTAGGMVRCRAADFDGDGRTDVLLTPGASAALGVRPVVLLARPPTMGTAWPIGESPFQPPADLPVRAFAYEATEVADFDGDQLLDVGVVSSFGFLDVAYGSGGGQFAPVVPLDFTIPNYLPVVGAPAVGLHALRDGPQTSLALVLAGTFAAGTPPTATVLRQLTPRVYSPPLVAETISVPQLDPLGLSIAADLDNAAPVELVVAARDEAQLQLFTLAVLKLGPQGLQVPLAQPGGAESPRNIRAMVCDRAIPTGTQPDPGTAVFLLHEFELDNRREKRLSTRLVVPPGSSLLPPDAVGEPQFPIHNVLIGDFRFDGGVRRDLALVRANVPQLDDGIVFINDDVSAFLLRPILPALPIPGLLPSSVAVMPTLGGGPDTLVGLTRDSRLVAVRWPTATPVALFGPELRLLSGDPVLRAGLLTDASRLLVQDIDGDGRDDLVALLSFDLAVPEEGQALVVVMHGRDTLVTEFPFLDAVGATPVHGRSAGMVLGDFAKGPLGSVTRLELAVAVPRGEVVGGIDGNHVRFYRYEAGSAVADGRFLPTAAAGGPAVLLVGSAPTELGVGDFDRDGRIDLLAACAGDRTLRLMRNTSSPSSDPNVRVGAFVEAAGVLGLGPGRPTRLLLSDVDGDGNTDAVAVTEETLPASLQLSTSVVTYIGNGAAGFTKLDPVSPTRTGNRNARLAAKLGDWNGDALPDLLLGWATSGVGDINLRILFGGSGVQR